MTARFNELDLLLFNVLNGEWTHPFLDWAMPRFTHFFQVWYPFFVLCLIVVVFGRRRGLVTGALMPLGLALSVCVSRGLLKPFFGRVRPSESISDVRLLIAAPESLSFPSTHATIGFAVATIVAARHRTLGFFMIGWAGLLAYSRVYVGVHYPFDLAVGACVGVMVGGCCIWAEQVFRRFFGRFIV